MASHSNIVHRDPDILGGKPVFVGTRVPVKSLAGLGVLVVRATTNRVRELRALVPLMLAGLARLTPGQVIEVG